jgi:RecB family exonuclease
VITLHFGLHFDPVGRLLPWPDLTAMNSTSPDRSEENNTGLVLNEMVAGPQVLLRSLEQHAGCSRPEPIPAIQVADYHRAIMRSIDHWAMEMDQKGAGPQKMQLRNLFFTRSFEADPEGVTKSLLQIREDLLMAGWDWQGLEGAPDRIADLALVEKVYRKSWMDYGMGPEAAQPGYHDRLEQCIRHWQPERLPEFSIVLYDVKLPLPWQRVMDSLAEHGFRVRKATRRLTPASSDLGNWQAYLSGNRNGSQKRVSQNTPSKIKEGERKGAAAIKGAAQSSLFVAAEGDSQIGQNTQTDLSSKKNTALKRDGSLIILKSKNEQAAAEALSSILSINQREEILILDDSNTFSLDLENEKRELAALGLSSKSTLRESGQLLILSTAFLWDPLDPRQIIDWLLLTDKPIPASLSRYLAGALSDYPGVYSEEWQDVVKAWESAGYSLDAYNEWFGKKRRTNIREGIETESVSSLFLSLKKWADQKAALLRKDLHAANKPPSEIDFVSDSKKENKSTQYLRKGESADDVEIETWLSFSREAEILARACQASEKQIWTKVELERFILTNLSSQRLAVRDPELGEFPVIGHHAALRDRPENLVWWNFHEQYLERDDFWSLEELKWLSGRQVKIESPEERAARSFDSLVRTVKSVKKQLVLVVTGSQAGSVQADHPLYASLQACFNDLNAITIDLDRAAAGTNWIKGWNWPEKSPVPIKPLGSPDPYWRVSGMEGVRVREQESYSSLSKLFHYPYQWILRYAAKIRRSDDPVIDLGPRVLGNLAHRAIERLLSSGDVPRDWTDTDIESRIDSVLEETISREGALLRLEGQEVELAAFRHTTRSALRFLLDILRKKRWEVIGLEKRLDGSVHNIGMMARADLLLKLENTVAIIDVKYGSLNRRASEIVEGNDIQLAVYDKLVRDQYEGCSVVSGYFVIVGPRLLTTNEIFGVATLTAKEAESMDRERQWSQLRETLDWRFTQFREGKIEVRRASTLDELDPPPPTVDVVKLEERNDLYDDYSLLAEPE